MKFILGSPDIASNWTPPGGAAMTSAGGAASSYSGGSQKSSTGPSNKTGSTQLSVNISTPQNFSSPRPQPSPSIAQQNPIKPFNPALAQPLSQPNTPMHIQPYGPNVRPSSSTMPNRQSPGSLTQPVASQPNTPSHIQGGAANTPVMGNPNSMSGKGLSPSSQVSDPNVAYHLPVTPPSQAEPLNSKQKLAQVQGTSKTNGGQTVINNFGKPVVSGVGNTGPNVRQQLIVRLPPPYNKNGSGNVETKVSNI